MRRPRSASRSTPRPSSVPAPRGGQPVLDVAAGRGEPVRRRAGTVRTDEHPVPQERGHERDPQPSGEVVVAGAGAPERVRVGALAQRPDRLGRRDARDRLQRLGDLWARQAVAPGAALPFHGDEVRVEQPAEVLADRRGGDPRLAREHARGQGAAVGQRHQHPGAAGVADERGDAGDVGVTGHATTVAPEHFGARRSDRGRRLGRWCWPSCAWATSWSCWTSPR